MRSFEPPPCWDTAVIEVHEGEVGGLPVAWRSARGGDPPILSLHGVPDSSELWTPFLERAGGIAPDLPGFGRSAKRGDLDYSIAGYAGWLERFCDLAGLERMRLVMHDWGVVGLAFAQRAPERVARSEERRVGEECRSRWSPY